MARIYDCEVLGYLFKYRGATRSELEESLALYPMDWQREDVLVSRCVVSSTDSSGNIVELNYQEQLAGMVYQLAQKIYEASGLTEAGERTFSLEAQVWSQSPAGQLEIDIMEAFPGLTISQIQSMDPVDWHKQGMAARLLLQKRDQETRAVMQSMNQGPPQARSARKNQKEIVPESTVAFGTLAK